MTWVRMHPLITNWPGGGGPPVFEINSDENGTAVIELAWDPQALGHPAAYPDPLRYYTTALPFSASLPKAAGGTSAVSVPSQTITLAGNRALWVMPAPLWAAYVEETLRTLGSPPASSFSCNLYYRVRVTPPGSATATVWPVDAAISGDAAASAPHIGILRVSTSAASPTLPDEAAVTALGGTPTVPDLWAKVMRAIWASSPDTDPVRISLSAVFAHPAFKATDPATRTALLRLWLFAGRSREKIPDLLSRETVVGSNLTVPIIQKTALKGGRTLVPQLLALLDAVPHPDLGVRTREQVVDDVITEILDPNGQLNQGLAGLCVPTSVQAYLVAVNPAEYVRLQVGWLSTSGSAELADGAVAAIPAGIFQLSRYGAARPNTGFVYRTFSEMAFQGAALRYAQGAAFPAADGTEATTQKIFDRVFAGGLSSDQTQRLMSSLFGVHFTVSPVAWPPMTSGLPAQQQQITAALLKDVDAHQQQVLMAMYWNNDPNQPLPAGQTVYPGHALLALRRTGGRVFFKNPQYAGSAPIAGMAAGGNAVNPPRRYEDPTATLESIAEPDLARWVLWYLVPDSPVI